MDLETQKSNSICGYNDEATFYEWNLLWIGYKVKYFIYFPSMVCIFNSWQEKVALASQFMGLYQIKSKDKMTKCYITTSRIVSYSRIWLLLGGNS